MAKSKLVSVFLPPGVQAKLYEVLGNCPRMLPADAAQKITTLWTRRNNCPEEELDSLDKQMLDIAVESSVMPGVMAQSTAINTKKNLIQSAIDRRDDRDQE
jgi:hypothetical protein